MSSVVIACSSSNCPSSYYSPLASNPALFIFSFFSFPLTIATPPTANRNSSHRYTPNRNSSHRHTPKRNYVGFWFRFPAPYFVTRREGEIESDFRFRSLGGTIDFRFRNLGISCDRSILGLALGSLGFVCVKASC